MMVDRHGIMDRCANGPNGCWICSSARHPEGPDGSRASSRARRMASRQWRPIQGSRIISLSWLPMLVLMFCFTVILRRELTCIMRK